MSEPTPLVKYWVRNTYWVDDAHLEPRNELHRVPMYLASDVDARLKAHEALVEALEAAKVKLHIYRSIATGEYHGGMEYMALMQMIGAALAQAKVPP